MGNIKDLKSNPENQLNIIDILSSFCPNGKSKYVETLYRIIRKTKNLTDYDKEIRSVAKEMEFFNMEYLNTLTPLQTVLVWKICTDLFDNDDIKNFGKFCEYNEKNLIKNKDLSTYNSFDQIDSEVNLTEMKLIEREMEKQIRVIHSEEGDEWMVIRPLTFESSKKYGSNTKWCTTFSDSSYFIKYSGNGILLYMINKIKSGGPSGP